MTVKFNLESFEDRNRINARIRWFKQLAEKIDYLSQYIYQNAPHAKAFVDNLIEDKRMSSFPEMQKLLGHASYKALDNYKEFAECCIEIKGKLLDEIIEMEKARNNFVPSYAKKKKG